MPAFVFKQFGTFIGPQFLDKTYSYDIVSKEAFWHTDIPIDTSFKKTDLGYVGYSAPGVYAGHHFDGIATVRLTLDSSMGHIPLYFHQVKQSFINGNVVANGVHLQNGTAIVNGKLTTTSSVSGSYKGPINKQGWKGFDIEHPKKEGKRIRHICVEGPEAAIYIRGRCKDTNVINLPEYWDGLVDIDQLSVNLTPFGVPQNLYVEDVKWGKQVIIKNSDGGPVNCYYQIWAPRLGDLVVEYDGESAADYPANQDEHSICGYHYDRRES